MNKKIEFQRDGLTIRGHVRGEKGQPQPAVILSHGFLANERMCRKYAKLLADLGYLTVTFDFCGGGIRSRSDGRSRDMTVLTEKEDLRPQDRACGGSAVKKPVCLIGVDGISSATPVSFGGNNIREEEGKNG